MTGKPAKKFKLESRGFLKVGHIADIVVFDPETIADRSTMEDPYQYAVGVKSLLVNGILTIENGVYNGKRSGMIYRKPHSWLPW